MLQIIVNKNLIQLMQPIEEVVSINIVHAPFVPIHVQKGQAKPIAEWVYSLCEKATGTITYNNTILDIDQIKSPEDIFK